MTDYKPLTSLLKQTNVPAKMLSYSLQLQQYKLEVRYVAEKANAVADALSKDTVELVNNDCLEIIHGTIIFKSTCKSPSDFRS